MSTITIALPDETLAGLRELAAERGVPPEELAARLVRDGLDQSGDDAEFEADLDYLLEKNAELYRRLAR